MKPSSGWPDSPPQPDSGTKRLAKRRSPISTPGRGGRSRVAASAPDSPASKPMPLDAHASPAIAEALGVSAPGPTEQLLDVPEEKAASKPIPSPDATPVGDDSPSALHQPLINVVICGFLAAAMLTLCLAPLGLGQMAFLAIAPLAWLTLDARRIPKLGYLVLFTCGLGMWTSLSLIEIKVGNGQLLGHLPMIAYLALQVPLFVLLGRLTRNRLRLPAYLTLPVLWCSLEWLRCHLFGGVALGLLAHAAADTRRILQLTDLAGSYGLGMLMVASGASVAELLWVTRRIRRIERRLPSVEAEAEEASAAFTSASRFAHGQFGDRKAKKKTSARESMEDAMRRNRDQAREIHLASVTLSVLVIVGVLVFANSYGRSRVVETRTWKLFEGNQYAMTVVGGPDSKEKFIAESTLNSTALLVSALNEHVAIPEGRRPVLLVSRTGPDDPTWRAQLRRAAKTSDDLILGKGAAGQPLLNAAWKPPVSFGLFPSDRKHIPLNMVATVATSASVEDTANVALRSLPEKGQRVDFVVVAIEPSEFDGSTWPRLLTRSVIAAAVANRCPIVAVVPNRMVAVATGDGGLWWSSADPAEEEAGDPLADGMSTSGPIQVRAMMDPRVSYYVANVGSYPALLCVLLTLLIPLRQVWILGRKRLQSREKPAATSN